MDQLRWHPQHYGHRPPVILLPIKQGSQADGVDAEGVAAASSVTGRKLGGYVVGSLNEITSGTGATVGSEKIEFSVSEPLLANGG